MCARISVFPQPGARIFPLPSQRLQVLTLSDDSPVVPLPRQSGQVSSSTLPSRRRPFGILSNDIALSFAGGSIQDQERQSSAAAAGAVSALVAAGRGVSGLVAICRGAPRPA